MIIRADPVGAEKKSAVVASLEWILRRVERAFQCDPNEPQISTNPLKRDQLDLCVRGYGGDEWHAAGIG